jgi:acyl transferase domain-containing protein
MAALRTAFVFPGLNGAAAVAGVPWQLRLPGFVVRWQLLAATFGARPGFAGFARALHAGAPLPRDPATWPWRALVVAAMQLATAERLEQRGEHAAWLAGYSIGDLARSVHAGVMSFAQLVAFAAALPELPAVSGGTLAIVTPGPAATAVLQRELTPVPVAVSRLSPRFLLLAGAEPELGRAAAVAQRHGAHARALGDCPLHAPALQPLATLLGTAAGTAALQPPQRRMFSTLWQRPITAGDSLAPEFAANVAAPVDFAAAVHTLHVEHGVTRFVDLGPGRHAERFVAHHGRGFEAVAAEAVLARTVTARPA